MAGIHVLPVQLVNKIAAGEVIERPASIVKELVENALDAGAARIDIAVEDGGRRLIGVRDDGAGMEAQDLALAFAPHATSKIATEEDLFAINTMGFRGEALASVASVSHAHIRTRKRHETASEEKTPQADDASGYEIEASGGMIGQARPCASGPGTAVTIRDVFFNMPARRKFLRAAATELGHVTEQLARLALPQAKVAFTLTHNGRAVQNLPAVSSTLQRVCDLFGPELAGPLLTVAPRGDSRPVRVSGLVGAPSAAKATGKWQYIFLNGRFIRDRLLSHALRDAYRGLVEASRWPVAFIFLEIDPAEVDVNVHPTKIEVRFRDSQAVHSEMLAALKETLNRSSLAPNVSLQAAAAGKWTPQPDGSTVDDAGDPLAASPVTGGTVSAEALSESLKDGPASDQQRRASLRQAMADFFRSAPRLQPRLSFPESTPIRPSSRTDAQDSYQPVGIENGPLLEKAGRSALSEGTYVAPPQEAPGPAASPLPSGRAIQVHNTYIIAPCEDGLIIVDQHALHERLLYNDLKRRLEASVLAGQRLLIPQTLAVTPAEADALGRHAELLARLGIEVAPFGPGAAAVQQFPSWLSGRGTQPAQFVRELLDKLAEDETADRERLLEGLLEMLACKAAVKAGDPLSGEEIDSLLARREDAEKGSACPHGRPTTLRLTLKDLEKQFKRL